MKYIAFDLEISTPIPAGATDWNQFRPFGISCAATWASDSPKPTLYFSKDNTRILDRMTKIDVCAMVDNLLAAARAGYQIVTFNGCGFDFSVCAEESGMAEQCKWLSLNHMDIYFFLFCKLGYAPGLDRLANGLELGNKTAGINGALAPQMWLDGKHEQVIDYCAQDVRLTLDLALKATELGCFHWKTRQEKPVTLDFDRLLTVSESMKLAEPDTSWMGANSWKRSKFTGWMG